MQGVGNDFVVVDAAQAEAGADWGSLAVRLCARRVGVGADGLLVVEKDVPGAWEGAGTAAFAMRMFNPDGTEDMCGNGLRCVGLWAWREGWLGGETEFVVGTREGAKRIRLESVDGNGGESASLRVDMGRPHFEPSEIPFCGRDEESVVEYPLAVGEKTFRVTSVNTGSTHTVIFGDAPGESEFQYYSPMIENHPLFPERTTVLWATPDGVNRYRVRIWERGVGETLGCGTGACAVGVCALLKRLASEDVPIEVVSRGGTLRIDWPGAEASVSMTGPAEFVYEGESAVADTV